MYFSHSHHDHHRFPSDTVFSQFCRPRAGSFLAAHCIGAAPPSHAGQGEPPGTRLLADSGSGNKKSEGPGVGPWPSWASVGGEKLPSLIPAAAKMQHLPADADTPAPAAAPPPSLAPRTPTIPAPYQLRQQQGKQRYRQHSQSSRPRQLPATSTQCSMPLTNRKHHTINISVPLYFVFVIMKFMGSRQDQPAPNPEHQVLRTS